MKANEPRRNLWPRRQNPLDRNRSVGDRNRDGDGRMGNRDGDGDGQ